MNIQLPLEVFKSREYGWRVNLGGAHTGFLDAWNVQDANGTLLVGGLVDGGGNHRSARPRLALKRDAETVVAAINAVANGSLDDVELQGFLAPAVVQEWGPRSLGQTKPLTEDQDNAFRLGVHLALKHQVLDPMPVSPTTPTRTRKPRP